MTHHRIYVASSWRQIPGPPREEWTSEHFGRVVLDHPVAERGFNFDMVALSQASACVIVLPCGRSAHLPPSRVQSLRRLLASRVVRVRSR